MTIADQTSRDYPAEIEELRARLSEAEETLRAIQSGEVDALVVAGPGGHQVFTLTGAERTYRLLIETMNEGALLLTPTGTVIYSNSAFAEMLGEPLERLTGSEFSNFVVEEHLQALCDLLQQGSQADARGEVRLKGAHGERPIPVFLSFSPLAIDEGAAVSLIVTDLTERKHIEEVEDLNRLLRDEITQRKRAEQALRNSEEYFRAVFDSSPDAIVVANDDGRYVSANPGAATLFGLSQQELVGRRISDFMEPGYDVDETWADFLRRGDVSAQLRLVRADGSVGEVEAYSTANMLPGRHLSILHDITDLKEAEREMLAARAEAEQHAAELESFVSSMGDGVVLFDAEPKVLLTNQATKDLMYPPPDVPYDVWIGAYELRTMDGDQVPLEQYPSRRALRGEVTKDARFRMTTPWRESMVSITGTPVWDAQCKVIGGTLAFHDISDQVEFEHEREQLLGRERHIAEVLQQAIMPPDVPGELLGYSIAVRYRPALAEAEIGGDFYDVFDLGDGKFAVVIGDVAGKGLPAAIRVAAARHAIRSYAYIDPRPARVLELANEALSRDSGPEEVFMLTALFIIVDASVGSITYASAGHEPPIICRSNGDYEELQFGGVPLGVIKGVTYPQVSLRVEPGDALLMLTDGITEARASGSALFGRQRVFDVLGEHSRSSPDEIASSLLGAATEYAGGHLQDDAAIVVVRRNPSA